MERLVMRLSRSEAPQSAYINLYNVPRKHGPEVEKCDGSTLTVQSRRVDRRYLSRSFWSIVTGELVRHLSSKVPLPALTKANHTAYSTLAGVDRGPRLTEYMRKTTRHLHPPCTRRQSLYPCPGIYQTYGTVNYLPG